MLHRIAPDRVVKRQHTGAGHPGGPPQAVDVPAPLLFIHDSRLAPAVRGAIAASWDLNVGGDQGPTRPNTRWAMVEKVLYWPNENGQIS